MGEKNLAHNYRKTIKINDLIGKLVLCVVNLPPRQIGPAIFEVLSLDVPDDKNGCILITPDITVLLGGRLY